MLYLRLLTHVPFSYPLFLVNVCIDTKPTSRITLEILLEIAKHLEHEKNYGTLANLNQCSKFIHQETLPILFKKVVWEKDEMHWVFDKGRVPEGWAYTTYVVFYVRYLENLAATVLNMRLSRDPQRLVSTFRRIRTSTGLSTLCSATKQGQRPQRIPVQFAQSHVPAPPKYFPLRRSTIDLSENNIFSVRSHHFPAHQLVRSRQYRHDKQQGPLGRHSERMSAQGFYSATPTSLSSAQEIDPVDQIMEILRNAPT